MCAVCGHFFIVMVPEMVNTVQNIGKVFLLFGPIEKSADPYIRSFKLRRTMCLSSALTRGMLDHRTLCLQG